LLGRNRSSFLLSVHQATRSTQKSWGCSGRSSAYYFSCTSFNSWPLTWLTQFQVNHGVFAKAQAKFVCEKRISWPKILSSCCNRFSINYHADNTAWPAKSAQSPSEPTVILNREIIEESKQSFIEFGSCYYAYLLLRPIKALLTILVMIVWLALIS